MRARTRLVLATAMALAVALPGSPAGAHHPDHGGGKEMFPGEGVVDGLHQHGSNEGHLPPVQNNVELIGKAEVTNPTPGQTNDGRVADVFAHGDYAYLTAFREPTCENAGVHVVDIHDPANPFEVTDAFMPTSVGSFAGEGIQVVSVDNEFFSGDLLIHQNETCPFGPPPPSALQSGGISLWDVTDPTNPEPVTLHTGDFEGGINEGPNQTHSMWAWFNEFDGRLYVVLVDDEELTDVDILDITDPFNPVLVNDTLDLAELFGVDQAEPAHLQSVFSHDMYVVKVGQRYVMNMSYWDGGYVLLDVTDPRPGQVSLIAESDFALLDEERLARGQEIAPEGNAHQSELSPDRNFLIATDEDFNPFAVTGSIETGPHAGFQYRANSANATPPIEEGTEISGAPTFVGLGCGVTNPGSVPPGTGVALIERGVCSFQEKLDSITAAGYSAGIVFNAVRPDCAGLVTMAAEGTIPFVFVSRDVGLRLLGQTIGADVCTQASPPAGSPTATTTIASVFDGWGYVRLFQTDIPRQRGRTGSIQQLDTYAIPEAQDPAFATGFGDLSIHEVAIDPDEKLAYFSYYAGGFRVASYDHDRLEEVGAFIDEGGNNFWGVEIWHDENGEKFVLASDRDFGLYIFQYTGPMP
jgi:PA domain